YLERLQTKRGCNDTETDNQRKYDFILRIVKASLPSHETAHSDSCTHGGSRSGGKTRGEKADADEQWGKLSHQRLERSCQFDDAGHFTAMNEGTGSDEDRSGNDASDSNGYDRVPAGFLQSFGAAPLLTHSGCMYEEVIRYYSSADQSNDHHYGTVRDARDERPLQHFRDFRSGYDHCCDESDTHHRYEEKHELLYDLITAADAEQQDDDTDYRCHIVFRYAE